MEDYEIVLGIALLGGILYMVSAGKSDTENKKGRNPGEGGKMAEEWLELCMQNTRLCQDLYDVVETEPLV